MKDQLEKATWFDILICIVLPFIGALLGLNALFKGETRRALTMLAIGLGIMSISIALAIPNFRKSLAQARHNATLVQAKHSANPTPAKHNTNLVAATESAAPLKLQGIIFSAKRPSAIVNGQTVLVGEQILGWRVQAIEPNRVILQTAGGETTTLSLN